MCSSTTRWRSRGSTSATESQDQAELRALGAGVTLDPAAAALGHRLDDRETKPGSALFAAGGEESLEDPLAVRLADAGSAIAHRERDSPVAPARGDRDRLPGSVSHRVVDQVPQRRLEVVGVDRERREVRLEVELEGCGVSRRE